MKLPRAITPNLQVGLRVALPHLAYRRRSCSTIFRMAPTAASV